VNSEENSNVVSLDENKDQTINKIIMGVGLKNCRDTYRDDRAKEAYNSFIARDLAYLSQYWEYISDDIQTDIIKRHKDRIFSIIKNLS